MDKLQKYQIELDKYTIDIYVEESDKEGCQILNEAIQKGRHHLHGPYSVDKHPPHNPTGEYHYHVYFKNNEILSFNKSGTGHDGYHGRTIPNKIRKSFIEVFPKENCPRVIESVEFTPRRDELLKMLIDYLN